MMKSQNFLLEASENNLYEKTAEYEMAVQVDEDLNATIEMREYEVATLINTN